MKTLKESTWGQIRNRINDDDVRMEENIEHLDRDGFLDYIETHYEAIDTFQTSIPMKSSSESKNVWMQIPIFAGSKYGPIFRLIVKFEGKDIIKISIDANEVRCKEFIDKLREKFEVKIDEMYAPVTITGKDGKLSKRICLKIFDTIIENVEFPKYKKREG